MLSKPVVIGALAGACLAAAAGGAYVAVRQSEAPPPSATEPTRLTAAQEPVSPAVHETEAEVSPASSPALPLEQPRVLPEPAPRPSAAPSSTRRPQRSRTGGESGRASQPAAAAPAAVPGPAPVPSASSSGRSSPAAAAEAVPDGDPWPSAAARTEPIAPAAPSFDELVVPSSAVIGLEIQTAVSSERARVEDRVEARVTRDVAVDGRTAIPAGSRVIGSVTLVEKGGRIRERARLGVRFHTLVLADGTELPMRTETVLREGDSPTGESTRKIGGAAAGGAILGAIIGGKKGAIVGGATGAAGGTAVVMSGDRNSATLPVGAVLTVRLSSPMTIAVEKERE